MIIHKSLQLSREDDVFYIVRKEQREQSAKAFKTFSSEHLRKAEKACTLAQVRDEFGTRPGITMSYFINDFIENLTLTSGDVDFELTIAQFPKEKKNHAINLTVGKNVLHRSISSKSTAESVAEFMAALIGWFPEYLAIEEKVETVEKQKILACDIAFDLLQRTIKPLLEEKGCTDYSLSSFRDTAQIKLKYNGGVCVNISVGLMEDFLDSTKNIVQSLPHL